MGTTGVVKVGQPSSPDGLIGRSPKSTCMRHTNARRGKTQQRRAREGREEKRGVKQTEENGRAGMKGNTAREFVQPTKRKKRVDVGRSSTRGVRDARTGVV